MVTSGGSSVQGATVKFYIDASVLGSSTSGSSGSASIPFYPSAGSHHWYVVVEKSGYDSVTSSERSFIFSKPQTQNTNYIINGLITVSPGDYNYYLFSVPSGATQAHVKGFFTASGGSGNDIYLYIMDRIDFINWQNGHTVNVYYNSGKVTTDNFDIYIPSGQMYYLVFSNTFSTFSTKTVSATVTLIYTP